MRSPFMLNELFSAIDEQDARKFAAFLAPDCTFRFGNLPPVSGAADVEKFVAGFFDSIDSLSHDVRASWDVPGGMICHGDVSYVRKDGSSLTVPFAYIFKLGPGGISEYLIYCDTSELYR